MDLPSYVTSHSDGTYSYLGPQDELYTLVPTSYLQVEKSGLLINGVRLQPVYSTLWEALSVRGNNILYPRPTSLPQALLRLDRIFLRAPTLDIVLTTYPKGTDLPRDIGLQVDILLREVQDQVGQVNVYLPNHHLLVATYSTPPMIRVEGILQYLLLEEGAEGTYLKALGVRKSSQKLGVGSYLLKDLPLPQYADCRIDNPSGYAWFMHRGFKETSRTKTLVHLRKSKNKKVRK